MRPDASRCSATAGCATCRAGWTSTSRCAAPTAGATPCAGAATGDVRDGGAADGRRCGRRGRGRRGGARAARKELARLDRQLDKLRDREDRLHDQMAAAATDHERVLELDAGLRALQASARRSRSGG